MNKNTNTDDLLDELRNWHLQKPKALISIAGAKNTLGYSNQEEKKILESVVEAAAAIGEPQITFLTIQDWRAVTVLYNLRHSKLFPHKTRELSRKQVFFSLGLTN